MRRIRCHYPSGDAFLEALATTRESNALEVYTTERFEPGEEVLVELYYTGLAAKMMVRAVGMRWHNARPRLRVRAGGELRCTGSEWRKVEFLRAVAAGEAELPGRRRSLRHPVIVEVAWRRVGEPDLTACTITELSENGALITTSAGLEVGDEVIVEIRTPGSARALEVLSVVRNRDHPAGVGVEFMARDIGGIHRLREVIRRIVEES